MGSQR